MRNLYILTCAAILCASCQSPQRQAALESADRQFCASIGAGQGQALMQCMIYRDNARREDRYRRSQAMLQAGIQLNQLAAQQAAANRPVTTNCHRMTATSVTCSSY